MSGGYYNQQPGFGVQPEPPQYLHQNYGYQNPGFAPAYQQQQQLGEEYLRQPASSPYPTAPTCMPEPVPVLRVVEPPPPPQPEPRVIIVQQAAPQPHDDCCAPVRCLCRCVDWLLTQICYVLLGLVLTGVLIALGLWLLNKYRHH